jgi:glutamate racemase
MKGHKILLLDSGIGGFSVFQEIRNLLPDVSVDYVADHAYFPYGKRSVTELSTRVSCLVDAMLSRIAQHQECYSLVVIACNTASTVVLQELRAKFDLPFVGVVPAIKPACAYSEAKSVGLLATEGTVSREYTHQLIRDFGSDVKITLVGCEELVWLAEQKLSGDAISIDQLKAQLAPFKEARVDCIVLGCTHFPLLKTELAQAAEWDVNWIDSGRAIALRVSNLLKAATHHSNLCSPVQSFYSTSKPHSLSYQSAPIVACQFDSFTHLPI